MLMPITVEGTTMMMMYRLIALLWAVSESYGLSVPTSVRVRSTGLYMASNDVLNAKDEAESMRAEIEEMRQEAFKRLEILNKRLQEKGDHIAIDESKGVSVDQLTRSESVQLKSEITEPLVATKNVEKPGAPLKREKELITLQDNRNRMELLHGTTWKITLNIGREPGTWMPKTWGESGERLLLNLIVEFSPEQLYEREEFLASMTGAKVLKIIDSELTVGPSLEEGSRKIAVKDGGWRIAPVEGPAETDLLRFYVEIEEDAQHNGCDVYCPKGRVYCTCGYFPMAQRRLSLKDAIRKEQDELSTKYEKLNRENEKDTAMLSFKKMQRSKQLFDIRMEAQELNNRMNKARIREPERDLLRLSRDKAVGLTREGGVCCKVPKGLAIEYHILGKFGVAAVDKKQHDDAESDENESLRL